MLRAMHGAAQTWVIKLLLAFLVVSFSIWGVGDMFRGNPRQRTVACIGGFYIPFNVFFGSGASICTGTRITAQTLDLEFRRKYDVARQKFGPDFTLNAAKQLGFYEKTLHELIGQVLLGHAAEELGIRYDDAAVIRQLAQQPELRTPDGKIDGDMLRRAINDLHMTEAEFIDTMRKTAEQSNVVGFFTMTTKAPDSFVQQLLAARGQERLLQVLKLDHSAMPAPVAPDDAALQAFHAGHADLFTAPEVRDFDVLKIMLDDVAKSITVGDADLAAAFDKRKDEFAHGERRDIDQIVVGDEAKAKQLAEVAAKTKDLKKSGAQMGLSAVTLEDQTEQSILPALYTNVFTAESGAVIGPVKSDFGWHVVQLARIKPPHQPALPEVADALRDKIRRERAADDIQALATKIDDALGGGRPVEEIAEEFKLPLAKFAGLDAKGKTADGKPADLPGPAGLVLKNGFALGEGESSGLLDDQHGNFLVVHAAKIIPAHLQPFAEVKDKTVAAWSEDRQTQAAEDNAAKIAADWQKNPNGFAELGARPGVSARMSAPISLLGETDKNLPATMMPQIFGLKASGIAVGADPKAHYIVRLAGFKPYDPNKNTGAQLTAKNKISQGWRRDISAEYELALRRQFRVRINEIVMESLRTPEVEDK